MNFNFLSIVNKQFCLITISLLVSLASLAQCPVTAIASSTKTRCGDSIILTAFANGCKPLSSNFNTGFFGSNWIDTSNALVTNGTGNYSCVGPAGEGTHYSWVGTQNAAPRKITTKGIDLLNSCSGASNATLCFSMKYGTQGAASPCEGPDLPEEGVFIQFSINNGASWQTLHYYDPNGGYDGTLTSWNRYCLILPSAAITSNTQFRWYQDKSSGLEFDLWGIDEVVIETDSPNYTFDWAHDSQGPTTSPETQKVAPILNKTYTVTYSNGVESCSSSIDIEVSMPQITLAASPNPVCEGNEVQLNVQSNLKAASPTSCGVVTDNTCNPVSTISDEKTVGTGTKSVSYNSADENIFCQFGDSKNKGQFLIQASELTTAGIVAGKITTLTFDIERIEENGDAGLTSVLYKRISIGIGFTSATTLSGYQEGIETVYDQTNVTLTKGLFTFFLQQGYNWDGVSNLIIQVCSEPPNGSFGPFAFPKYNLPGYTCFYNTTGSSGTSFCSTGPFSGTNNFRPNVTIGFCRPNDDILTYQWSSNTTEFNSTLRNPKETPTENTTYTVTVNSENRPISCAVTGSISLTVNSKPTVTASSNSPECEGETIQLYGTSDPVQVDSYHWTGPNSFVSSLQNPQINQIDPNQAGQYDLYVSLNNCNSQIVSTIVEVNQTDNAAFTYDKASYCLGSQNPVPTITAVSGGTFTSSPPGLIFTDSSTGEIDNLNSNSGAYTIQYTTNGNCPGKHEVPITLLDTPIATATIDSPICKGHTAQFNGFSNPSLVDSYSWTGPSGFYSTQKDASLSDVNETNEGLYDFSVTLNGCKSITSYVTLQITPKDESEFTYSKSMYCKSEANPSPTFVGISDGSFSTFPPGLVFTNQYSGEIDLEASENGDYEITFYTPYNSDNCVDTAYFNLTIDACAGITTFDQEKTRIYPNPNNGMFTIRTAGNTLKTIRVFDQTGRLFYLQELLKNEKEIILNLTSLSVGVYTLQLEFETKREFVKLSIVN
jgi:hypothetical protein